ncbi:MAG: hypothetical protein ABSA14_16175 [Acidimicrobiales bacterium]
MRRLVGRLCTFWTDAVTDACTPMPFGLDLEANHADEPGTLYELDAQLIATPCCLVRFGDDRG